MSTHARHVNPRAPAEDSWRSVYGCPGTDDRVLADVARIETITITELDLGGSKELTVEGMRHHGTRDLRSRRRSVSAYEMVRAKGDARDAKAALHARCDHERTRQHPPLLGGNPFERDDAPPARRLRRHRAGHFRIASTNTRQQPHCPCGWHPSLIDVTPQRVRSVSSSVSPSRTSTCSGAPFSMRLRAAMVCEADHGCSLRSMSKVTGRCEEVPDLRRVPLRGERPSTNGWPEVQRAVTGRQYRPPFGKRHALVHDYFGIDRPLQKRHDTPNEGMMPNIDCCTAVARTLPSAAVS
jgi:hypothetical protein